MTEEKLDALLARMLQIAEAVNKFASEAIQQEAFAALLAAYHGRQPSTPRAESLPEEPAAENDAAGQQAGPAPSQTPLPGSPQKKARRSGAGSKESFRFARDLDLRPQGKPSFVDFVEAKKPKSNEDKFAVAVYYLQHILEFPAVSGDHVGSVFRLTPGWREPSDVKASLRVASTRKGTIDTTNMEDIRTTPNGRNFVDHDLPAAQKGKK